MMRKRYYFESECAAFCFAHRALADGEIVVGTGSEVVNGKTAYWVDEII